MDGFDSCHGPQNTQVQHSSEQQPEYLLNFVLVVARGVLVFFWDIVRVCRRVRSVKSYRRVWGHITPDYMGFPSGVVIPLNGVHEQC